MRKEYKVALVASIAGVSGFVSTGTANARSAGDVVVSSVRPDVCSIAAWMDLDAEIYNQVNTQGNLLSIGRVNSWGSPTGPNIPAYCGNVAFTVMAETKVCGAWGCNYHTKGQWGRSGSGRGESPWTRTATQACRSGVNRYHTYVVYDSGYVQFEWQTPTASEQSTFTGSAPEYNCAGK